MDRETTLLRGHANIASLKTLIRTIAIIEISCIEIRLLYRPIQIEIEKDNHQDATVSRPNSNRMHEIIQISDSKETDTVNC